MYVFNFSFARFLNSLQLNQLIFYLLHRTEQNRHLFLLYFEELEDEDFEACTFISFKRV